MLDFGLLTMETQIIMEISALIGLNVMRKRIKLCLVTMLIV